MSAAFFPMPEYLLKDGNPPVFCFRGYDWYCTLCDKYATEQHVGSDYHRKKRLWGKDSAPSPPSMLTSTNAHCPQCVLTSSTWTKYYCQKQRHPYYHNSEHNLTSWYPPPPWWNNWVAQVREARMFTSKTIVDICGGPDLQGAEPPHVGFLADARSKPKCADVKKFFGNKVFENLQQRAQHHGKTHPRVAPFGQEGSFR